MQFLNPRTDVAFRKIFASAASGETLISFLNAILDLAGEDLIVDATIIDPSLGPEIEGMKNTYPDVQVRDQRGRTYIAAIQVLNVEGFEKRVLHDACTAHGDPLALGDPHPILSAVVAVTISDFAIFADRSEPISRFRLRAAESAAISPQDLDLVFAELPKFTKTVAELETALDLWLYFLKGATDLTEIPDALAVEPALVKAFELADRAAWTEDEYHALVRSETWISDLRRIRAETLQRFQEVERKVLEAEQNVHEAAECVREAGRNVREANRRIKKSERKILEIEQRAQEIEENVRAQARADMFVQLLELRFGPLDAVIEHHVRTATSVELDAWILRFVDARALGDVLATQRQMWRH